MPTIGFVMVSVVLNLWERALDLLSEVSIYIVNMVSYLSPKLAALLAGNPAVVAPIILIGIIVSVIMVSLIKRIVQRNK